ncbi:hypothetical protein BUALT_Bualt15G0075700 [Buddleja alternifolia]|uniref:Uncharacterized protein n=1 Tax=Buddleja alternifolia TaxID=168488 RepID=A0AAV6WF82_9LAMI|nr:hypothetical protein BUALT_Bualt15G0075700 [Buddleja alternifolia]
MDFQFTEPEMDAALLLIQLSGDSAESDGAAAKTVEQSGGEESVGDSYEISSAGELEILPRRKRRFRSIDDIYGTVIKKQAGAVPHGGPIDDRPAVPASFATCYVLCCTQLPRTLSEQDISYTEIVLYPAV